MHCIKPQNRYCILLRFIKNSTCLSPKLKALRQKIWISNKFFKVVDGSQTLKKESNPSWNMYWTKIAQYCFSIFPTVCPPIFHRGFRVLLVCVHPVPAKCGEHKYIEFPVTEISMNEYGIWKRKKFKKKRGEKTELVLFNIYPVKVSTLVLFLSVLTS